MRNAECGILETALYPELYRFSYFPHSNFRILDTQNL